MDDKRPNTGGNKALWFKFWGTDFYDDTAHWTLQQQGAYMRLLWSQWVNKSIPGAAEDIFEIKNGIEQAWHRLEEKFPMCDDGLRRNGKLERVRADMEDQAAKRHDAASKAGKASARQRAANAASTNRSTTVEPPFNAECTKQEARSKTLEAEMPEAEKQETESKHTLSVAEPVGDDAGKPKQPRIDKADIERVWSEFPRKVGKLKALPAIAKAIRIVSDERGIETAPAVDFLVQSVQRLSRQSKDKETQYVPHPITWLNQGRYLDPVGESRPTPSVSTSPVANNAPKLDRSEVQAGKAAMLARVLACTHGKIEEAIQAVRKSGKAFEPDDDPKNWSGLALVYVTSALDKIESGGLTQRKAAV